jgi:hypothetical protein
VVPVAAVLALLTGCGAAGQANPEKIGPRGVDELVIPTPDPDPDDFVDRVDNPWLPLAPGTVWSYDVSGSVVRGLEVSVEDEPQVVARISCVVVHSVGTDARGDVVIEGEAYYAQDSRGNVWVFGEDTRSLAPATRGLSQSWSADVHGAEAGLAMPASPRVGDGYVRALLPSGAERSTVLSLDEERTVPAGTFGGLLLVIETPGDAPGGESVFRRAYAEGIGLVQEARSGGIGSLDLASVSAPPG